MNSIFPSPSIKVPAPFPCGSLGPRGGSFKMNVTNERSQNALQPAARG